MQEDIQADNDRIDRLVDILEAPQEVAGPPEATLSRRAQSYSDFHDAVKAVLGQNISFEDAAKETSKDDKKIDEKDIVSELDFAGWYNGLEHELLESSQDEFTSAHLGRV